MLVTPRNVVDLVLTNKAVAAPLRFYENKLQKWLFWSAIGSLFVGMLIAVSAYFAKNTLVAWFALGLIAIAALSSIGYQFATTLPELLRLRHAEHDAGRSIADVFNDDMDLIGQIVRNHELHHIRYARESFVAAAAGMRGRISLLVGAFDKVGVIPIGVTAYLSATKAAKEGYLNFSGVEWSFVGFVLLYLFAIRMSTVAQWLERMGVLYGEAMIRKQVSANEASQVSRAK